MYYHGPNVVELRQLKSEFKAEVFLLTKISI